MHGGIKNKAISPSDDVRISSEGSTSENWLVENEPFGQSRGLTIFVAIPTFSCMNPLTRQRLASAERGQAVNSDGTSPS
jgi:hypothetical protein